MSAILLQPHCGNPSGAETKIVWNDNVNAMTADALEPCFARASATMASTGQDKLIFFHEDEFQLPTSTLLKNDKKRK